MTGIDWRQKLENQRGAVIATELKNNANKLAKWTVQSLLAGADQMKLGYVTRAHPRVSAKCGVCVAESAAFVTMRTFVLQSS